MELRHSSYLYFIPHISETFDDRALDSTSISFVMHFLSPHLGVFGLDLFGDETFFHGLYHVQTFLGSWGYTIFLFVFALLGVTRRSQSTLFCTRAMTFWILQCLVFSLSRRLTIFAQLLHFFCHHLLFHIVPLLDMMFWMWKDTFVCFLLSISSTRPKRWKVKREQTRFLFYGTDMQSVT